jgi:hypothetical protein
MLLVCARQVDRRVGMSRVLETVKGSGCGGSAVQRGSRRRWRVSVGDLIAAAFEAAGGDGKRVKALLSSRELSNALKKRIVLV